MIAFVSFVVRVCVLSCVFFMAFFVVCLFVECLRGGLAVVGAVLCGTLLLSPAFLGLVLWSDVF